MARYVVRKLDGAFVAATEDIGEAIRLADETEGGAHFSEEAAPRELPDTLRAIAGAAGVRHERVNWPVAIINAVWAAKEVPEGKDGMGQINALDRIEALLGELLGVEPAEMLGITDMVERLMSMRTAVDGGAVFIVGPAGLKPMRALLDGEGSPEEMEQFSKAIDAAIRANAEMDAEPEPSDV